MSVLSSAPKLGIDSLSASGGRGYGHDARWAAPKRPSTPCKAPTRRPTVKPQQSEPESLRSARRPWLERLPHAWCWRRRSVRTGEWQLPSRRANQESRGPRPLHQCVGKESSRHSLNANSTVLQITARSSWIRLPAGKVVGRECFVSSSVTQVIHMDTLLASVISSAEVMTTVVVSASALPA